MALKKPTTTETTTAASFEEEPGTATATVETPAAAPAAAPAAPAPVANAPAAAAEASTALAKAASTSVGAVNDLINKAKGFQKEVEAMEDAADFSWGSHRVLKADNGMIKEMQGEKVKLGRWLKVRMLAWGRHWEISPGDQGKDSAKFVAYSKEGKTVDYVVGDELKKHEGTSVDAYVEFLRKEEDFDKAGKREFIDTQVFVLGSEKDGMTGEIAQVTLASSSIPAFKKYQGDLLAKAKAASYGLPGVNLPDDPFTFYFVTEDAEKGSNTWTKLKICAQLPTNL